MPTVAIDLRLALAFFGGRNPLLPLTPVCATADETPPEIIRKGSCILVASQLGVGQPF
jgi:hypothetical protein